MSESRWRRPSEYTPILAALQFCIRVMGLQCALPLEQRDDYIYDPTLTPLMKFQQFHFLWIVDGSASPFSYVYRLLNYSMAASRNSKGGDNLRFSNDGQYCFYEGYGFEIAAWKGMVKDIIRSAETLLSRRLMFRNLDTVEPINPYTVIDSEGNYVNNHYFAASDSEYRNTACTELLKSLQKSERWERLVKIENGKLKFVKTEVDEYTKGDIAFRGLLLLPINWTGGLTG